MHAVHALKGKATHIGKALIHIKLIFKKIKTNFLCLTKFSLDLNIFCTLFIHVLWILWFLPFFDYYACCEMNMVVITLFKSTEI